MQRLYAAQNQELEDLITLKLCSEKYMSKKLDFELTALFVSALTFSRKWFIF